MAVAGTEAIASPWRNRTAMSSSGVGVKGRTSARIAATITPAPIWRAWPMRGASIENGMRKQAMATFVADTVRLAVGPSIP